MTRSTALISIPANLVARDFIATGLVQRIAETGLGVVLCCHARDRQAVEALANGMPLRVATYREVGFLFDSAHALLADVRFSLQGTISGHMANVRRRIAAHLPLRVWSAVCVSTPRLAARVLNGMDRLLDARAQRVTGPLLDEWRPAVVVTPGPGFRAEDRSLLRAARRSGVPTVSVVSSWDNLTARGAVKSAADIIAVWNEPMRRHAVQYHGLDAARILITGVPAFDAYVGIESRISRAENAVYLGLPGADTSYITFLSGMLVSEAECADLRELLEALAEAYPDGGAPWVVVRVHPNEDPSHFAEFRGRAGVVLNFEGAERATRDQQLGASPRSPVMNTEAHLRKAALLRYSAVVLASLCTTALVEACLFDRPVVAIERDRPGVTPAVQSLIASLASYTHQTDFRDSGALEVVHDVPAALTAILRALKQPDRLRQERQRATALLCGPLDGQSAARVATLIHRTALGD